MELAVAPTQLGAHFWEAGNILRGPANAVDFETYLFPLLFFKRISDVYDEQHRFQIPEGYHWREVPARATEVGQALQLAFRKVEEADPSALPCTSVAGVD